MAAEDMLVRKHWAGLGASESERDELGYTNGGTIRRRRA